MRRPARAALAVLALALAGAAAAQAPTIVSGGFRVTLEPAFTVEVSLERPLVLADEGWRVALVTSLRGRAAPGAVEASALAGLTATLPAADGYAVQAQLLYRVAWATAGAHAGPELVVTFSNFH